MIGGAPAAWSATSGVHTFTVCQAVTRLPVGQPRVVTAQIHDAHHAVLQIRLEDTHLILVDGAGKKRSVLDPHYTLATPYRVTLVAAHGRIEVGYNGHHAGTISTVSVCVRVCMRTDGPARSGPPPDDTTHAC